MLADVFGWDYVEAHPGWLIFKLPPAELGVHPVGDGGTPMHKLSFMCDDLDSDDDPPPRPRDGLPRQAPEPRASGSRSRCSCPGGVEAQLYEPRHETAI